MLTETPDPVVMQHVVAAARRCFIRYGVDRTTMDDIGKESGIGRTGIYRLGVTRPEITQAAIVARFRELADGIRPVAAREAPFAELLMETSLATVEISRTDPELQHLLDTTTTVSLHRLMTGGGSIMQELVVDVLAPMLDRARDRGEIRAEVTNDRAAEWLRSVYTMLILREDLDTDGERSLITEFVLPSLRANP